MNVIVKTKLIKILFVTVLLTVLFLTFTLLGQAQEYTLSLTSGGYPKTSGTRAGTPPANQSPERTKLVANLNFGDVSPLNTTAKMVCIIPIRVSANGNYKVEIKRTNSSLGGPQPKDIGLGIVNFRPQVPGSNLLHNNALLISAGGFANDPRSVKFSNGAPQFATTMEDVSTGFGTTLFTGSVTTSESKNVNKDEASIIADLVFVIVPQYFDPSDGMNIIVDIKITPTN